MKALKKIFGIYNHSSLILRIIIGIVIGTGLALLFPKATWIAMLGTLFVNAIEDIQV